MLLRWLVVIALAWLVTLALAFALGVSAWFIAPERDLVGRTLEDALAASGLTGALGGLVVSPLLAFWILRDVNRSVTHPDQERDWWRRAHLLMLKTAGAVLLVGAAFGAVVARVGLCQGRTAGDIRGAFAWGLLWGGGGALVLASLRGSMLAFGADDVLED